MDLDVVMRSNDCPFIVQFYGALFKEVSKENSFIYYRKFNYFNAYKFNIKMMKVKCVVLL